MNKNNAKDYLPFVQALAEGKSIEIKTYNDRNWRVIESMIFNYPPDNYRIKDDYQELKDACEKGKTIQYFSKNDKIWVDCTPTWFFPLEDYRIKPEPEVFYMINYTLKHETNTVFVKSLEVVNEMREKFSFDKFKTFECKEIL